MKPSERIRNVAIKRLKPYTLKVSILEQEILNFLDEQHEEHQKAVEKLKRDLVD